MGGGWSVVSSLKGSNVFQFLSTEFVLQQMEVDSQMRPNVEQLVQQALQANPLDRVQAVLWLHESRVLNELSAAATLWPCQAWPASPAGNQQACSWLHALSLTLQSIYRQQLSGLATL